jgi:hypothetical protein
MGQMKFDVCKALPRTTESTTYIQSCHPKLRCRYSHALERLTHLVLLVPGDTEWMLIDRLRPRYSQ